MENMKELREELSQKIKEGSLSAYDLKNYFLIFCEIGKDSEDFQEEIENWERIISFDLGEAGIFWISTYGGEISTGTGDQEQVDLKLKLSLENVIKVFSGELDPGTAFMTGKLKLKGELPDAMKFNELMEIVAEEIEYN